MSAFPFHGVVGHDDLKLALLLCAVDPSIGGVLLRGEKGSAKTTIARAFAPLLPGSGRFVDLPVGASPDRVVGSIDLAAILAGGANSFRPGLLHAANGGVLYIDEVNLLPDHLVDVLLDVAATGVNRVERDGVSHEHPARFVLVGSMNPEEGELRPQFLDRFGLVVDVSASRVPAERAEAVRRRLDFERDPESLRAFADEDLSMAARLAAVAPAEIGADIMQLASMVSVEVGAEGLRADLTLSRAAAALAGLEGRMRADESDLRRVAHLVLAHRRRRSPLDPPTMRPEETSEAFDRAAERPPADDASLGEHPAAGEAEPAGQSRPQEPSAPTPSPVLALPTTAARHPRPSSSGKSAVTGTTSRGRSISDSPYTDGSSALAVIPTVRRVAERHPTGRAALHVDDLRAEVRESAVARLVVFVVDASGSMATRRRIDAATGAVMGLLGDAYRRRDRVALVSFAGTDAHVVLRPTASVELARARLAGIPVGGSTPLAAGLLAAHDLVSSSRTDDLVPLVVVLTDGRATAALHGRDPFDAALEAAARFRRDGVELLVIDVEDAPIRLQLAARLAGSVGARCVRLDDLAPRAVEDAVRRQVAKLGPEGR